MMPNAGRPDQAIISKLPTVLLSFMLSSLALSIWPPLKQCLRVLVLCAAGFHAMAQASAGDSNSITVEQRVKAASLFKFVGYVDWPPQALPTPTTSYVVGVAGAEEIGEELARISNGRTINDRLVKVRRLKLGESLAGVHILFIGRDERSRQAQWLQMAQKQPVLTVTETEGALAQGSMINFQLVDDRVRFEISLDAIEKSDVRVSSRMLSVALNVSKRPRQ